MTSSQITSLFVIRHSQLVYVLLLLRGISTVRCSGWYTDPFGWKSSTVRGVRVLNSFIQDRLFIHWEEQIFIISAQST